MKTYRPPRALHAEAGPRIRAPQRSAKRTPAGFAGGDVLDQQLLRTARNGAEAAAVLLLQLRDDPLALLPWSLDRRDPIRHLTPIIAAALTVPTALVLLGASPWWGAGALAAGCCGIYRLLTCGARRTAVAAREIQTELEHGTPLREIEGELEDLVRDAPDLDGARLLLAQSRLEGGEPLAALLQLAPLRDRHPREGAVVLIAALAYAQLGAEEDAMRMLEVLRVEQVDSWSEQVARFHELCLLARGAGARASSDNFDIEV